MRSSPVPLAVVLAVFAGCALAAGHAETAPVPSVPPPGWAGVYGGGSLGYGGASGPDPDLEALSYGVHAGYDVQVGGVILGGEIDLAGLDVSQEVTGIELDSIARAKLRLGYDTGRVLPYGVVGLAQVATSGTTEVEEGGTLYGVGLDYRVTDVMRLGAEVLRHDFEDLGGPGRDVTATTASARISFNF